MKTLRLAIFRRCSKPSFEAFHTKQSKPVALSAFWILFPYLTILIILIVLVIRLYACNKGRFKEDKHLKEYINTVHELDKSLNQLSETLNEVSFLTGMDGPQRDKVKLAIWRITTMQSTMTGLKQLEIETKQSDDRDRSLATNLEHFTEEPPLTVLENTDESNQFFLEKVFSIIREFYVDPAFNVDILSQKMGMSRSSFYNKIKAISGQAPADFIRQYRMEGAKELLKTRQYTITEVAYKSGFTDVKYFRFVFKKKYKRSPSEYSKSGS